MNSLNEKKKKYGKYEDYEIESLARDYINIEECKKDESKFAYVMEELKAQQKDKKSEIKSIEDLLKVGESKRMEDKEEEKEDGES